MRNKILAVLMTVAAFGGVSALFWDQELKYQLPTPIPEGYLPVDVGRHINLPANIPVTAGKPLFIHFFNPGCPCSRFNVRHFLTLVRQYNKDIRFVAVVPDNEDITAAENMLSPQVSVRPDNDKSIAKLCGVYASPQAVLLTAQGVMYYKGNYNRSRYCTQKQTSYAAMAVESLVANRPAPAFDTLATRAYGCQLPQPSNGMASNETNN